MTIERAGISPDEGRRHSKWYEGTYLRTSSQTDWLAGRFALAPSRSADSETTGASEK